MAKIQITNDSGYTLINDYFMNMSLQNKGSLTMSYDTQDGAGWYQDVTYSANSQSYQPIIAVRCTSHKATVYRTIKSGNSYTFRIMYTNNDNSSFPSTVQGNYYIFDINNDNYVGSGHLILKDENGKIVFDSDLKYMRVVSINDFPAFTTVSQPRTEISTPGDKIYAAVCLNYGYYYQYSSTYEDRYYTIDVFYMYDAIIFKPSSFVNQGATFFAYTYEQISSGGNGSSASFSGRYMIIDVTGY